jgi:cell division protein FtsQ
VTTRVRDWRPPASDPVVDDPRMRARRVDVARSAGRRRMRRLNVVLALVCAVVWVLVALRSPVLDVDRVQVVGAERTTIEEIRRASRTGPGAPMFEVDLGRARDGVAALPWIDEVRTTRMWPGTVRIVVTERHEVAAVAHDSGWALLDAEGRVLAVVAERPDLPALPGESGADPGGRVGADDRSALAVLGDLPTELRSLVEATAEGPDGLELVLTDGFRVVLGDGEALSAKADAAVAVRDHAGDPEANGCRIDVRVPSAPVLTTGRGCA